MPRNVWENLQGLDDSCFPVERGQGPDFLGSVIDRCQAVKENFNENCWFLLRDCIIDAWQSTVIGWRTITGSQRVIDQLQNELTKCQANLVECQDNLSEYRAYAGEMSEYANKLEDERAVLCELLQTERENTQAQAHLLREQHAQIKHGIQEEYRLRTIIALGADPATYPPARAPLPNRSDFLAAIAYTQRENRQLYMEKRNPHYLEPTGPGRTQRIMSN